MQIIFIGLRSLEKAFFFPFLTTLLIEITWSQSDSILLFFTLTFWPVFSASLMASFVLWWNALIFLTFISCVKDNWRCFTIVLFYSLVPQWKVWEVPWIIVSTVTWKIMIFRSSLKGKGPGLTRSNSVVNRRVSLSVSCVFWMRTGGLKT